MEARKTASSREVDVETASIVSQILSEILDSSTRQPEPPTSPCCSHTGTASQPIGDHTQPTCSKTHQGDTCSNKSTRKDDEDDRKATEETPPEVPFKTCTVKEILTEILDCTVICRPQLQLPPVPELSERNLLECSSPPPEYMFNPGIDPRLIYNYRRDSDDSVSSRMQCTVKEVLSEIMDYTVVKRMDRQVNVYDYNRPGTSRSGQVEREEHVREYEVYRVIGAGIVNSANAIHDEAYLHKTTAVQRILPSYSSVLKMGPAPNNILPIGSCGSFVPRKPPPSYAEVEGIWEDSPSLISSESALFGPDPTYMICPRCRTAVVTDVQVHRSIVTHLIALCLCLCLCWPCCLMPYCLRSCNYTHHTCPHCSYYFGMYRPF